MILHSAFKNFFLSPVFKVKKKMYNVDNKGQYVVNMTIKKI